MAMKTYIKENVVDKQTTYILYMIIGSYFRKCTCRTKFLEQSLFLYYKDMKENKQVKTEERIIHQMETQYTELVEKISGLDCEVTMVKTTELLKVRFSSVTVQVAVLVNKKGKYTICYTKGKNDQSNDWSKERVKSQVIAPETAA